VAQVLQAYDPPTLRAPACSRNAAAIVRAGTAADCLAMTERRAPPVGSAALFRASTRPAPSFAWVRCRYAREYRAHSIIL